MSSTIIDRVAVHGETGNVTLSRGRDGTFYLEARPHKGERVVVQLHRDAVTGEDGLVDQLVSFTGWKPDLRPPKNATFADLLRWAMDHHDVTGKELARVCDVSPSTISNWRGGGSQPWRKYWRRIAETLKVDFAALEAAMARDEPGNGRNP